MSMREERQSSKVRWEGKPKEQAIERKKESSEGSNRRK